ncbi:hypothetical protein BAUCODRAFT_29432 [Baudoinia panamericana UAMH 10762]|uniref:Uncharacterized protein n=1 Tax=Baudoinia panamericana (strain UAMH 10762) TaxID=717646 RepID=M2NPY7_BAUPA|nr:uncharacterized protein BAUCODRAFT_29432 [Baudoinia panamericana UAMH 10762]EMD01051.1 hypothetical protein BAUCODRAFT_29432 [Baudoinia panamericana UAMH 10762]
MLRSHHAAPHALCIIYFSSTPVCLDISTSLHPHICTHAQPVCGIQYFTRSVIAPRLRRRIRIPRRDVIARRLRQRPGLRLSPLSVQLPTKLALASRRGFGSFLPTSSVSEAYSSQPQPYECHMGDEPLDAGLQLTARPSRPFCHRVGVGVRLLAFRPP